MASHRIHASTQSSLTARLIDAALLGQSQRLAVSEHIAAIVSYFACLMVLFGAAAIAGSGLLALLGERAFSGRPTIRSIFQTISDIMPNAGRPDR